MAGFSIDDVRDTFTADITSLLLRIQKASAELDASPLLDVAAWPAAPQLLETIAQSSHSIAGTSGLVSATSLYESAKLIESMCGDGVALMAQATLAAARAKQIVEMCVEGAAEMHAMLDLELEHRGAEAIQLAHAFAGRASTFADPGGLGAPGHLAELDAATPAVGARDLPAYTPPAGEFSFDDVDMEQTQASAGVIHPLAAAARAPVVVDDGANELREIFQQEAREALGALDGHLRVLSGQHDDLAALGHVERLFHTLKGAAATVGNAEASVLAASLQELTERAVENDGRATPELLSSVMHGMARLRQLAGLPEHDPHAGADHRGSGAHAGTAGPHASVAAASVGSADSMAVARAEFAEEARQICARARALAAQLPSAGARSVEVAAELARLFHRLKGSALVTTDPAVASEATRLQALAEASAPRLGEELARGLARIEDVLDLAPRARPQPQPARAPRPAGVAVREPVQVPDEPELWDAFTQECVELLERLDRAVLALETSSQPKDAIEGLAGLVHTLKGAVNAVGLTPTGRVLHRVEDLLDRLVTAAILPPVRGVVRLLLNVQNEVRANMAEAPRGYVETSLAQIDAEIARLFAGEPLEGPSHSAESGISREDVSQSARGVRTPGASDAPVERKFIRVATERLDALMNLAGELVVARSRLMIRVAMLKGLHEELAFSRRRILDTVDRFRSDNEFSILDVRGGKASTAEALPPLAAPKTGGVSGFSELELDRYDDVNILARSLAEITDDVSETNAQLLRELSGFSDDADAFGAIVSGIQGEVTRSRMVPLEVVFARLLLPVRDAAEREGKEARVTTRGEDVRLDKTIADALFAPLLHLVRNAVVHGIEAPSARARAGKDRTGVITLGAREESGQIVVEVRDDGAGLDLKALRLRGEAMGLLRPGTPLEDPAVKELVFAPKLSTLAEAGAVAGRGLGGDVVRRSIERLNGDIRIDSQAGRGTTFAITLPLTLAITKALIVRQGGGFYAVPLHFAERIVDAEGATQLESAGVRRIKVDGAFLAVHALSSVLKLGPEGPGGGPILVLRVGDQRTTVQVDAVLGQEEIVVKSLGDVLTGHPLFAGVTIRGTGDLVLIIDVPALVDGSGFAREDGARSPRSSGTAPPAAGAASADEALGSRDEMRSAAKPKERASSVRGAAAPRAEPRALPAEASPTPSPPRADVAVGARSRLRILFVDDSLSVRKVAEKMLAGLGVDVTLAVDGLDAIGKLREQSFDLIFTDLEMPRMHGYDLIRELRFVPATSQIPILVVSSRSAQKHQDQARALGATDYLTKPFTAETLGAALARWGGAGGKKGAGPAGGAGR